jgi:hypothetical protein
VPDVGAGLRRVHGNSGRGRGLWPCAVFETAAACDLLLTCVLNGDQFMATDVLTDPDSQDLARALLRLAIRYALSASYPAQGAFGGSGTASSTPLIVGKAASAVTLALSAGKVTYGGEQQVKLTVRVRPQFTGVPAGQVVISAGTMRVCALTLRAGAGSCRPGATGLMAGLYTLTARYRGDRNLRPGTATARLTVGRARSVTGLRLSARRVRYGHEQGERLSVTVRPQFVGVPAGIVAITGRRGTVCTLVLHAGKASCTLRRRQLTPGNYHLTATYHGNRDFTRSTATATLTVTR